MSQIECQFLVFQLQVMMYSCKIAMVQGWWGGGKGPEPGGVHLLLYTKHLAPKYPNLMLSKRVEYTRQNFDYDANKLAF